MSEIKPIETVYNGYRFRSRLEARWAVFFDAMGIKYEYEPEGFEFDDGTKYLPDFLLHVFCQNHKAVYAEVKGVMSESDLNKIMLFGEHHPVIVLGNLPGDLIEYIELWQNDKLFHSFKFIDGRNSFAPFKISRLGPIICNYYDIDEQDCETMGKALLKARQARFEHGECGAPK